MKILDSVVTYEISRHGLLWAILLITVVLTLLAIGVINVCKPGEKETGFAIAAGTLLIGIIIGILIAEMTQPILTQKGLITNLTPDNTTYSIVQLDETASYLELTQNYKLIPISETIFYAEEIKNDN